MRKRKRRKHKQPTPKKICPPMPPPTALENLSVPPLSIAIAPSEQPKGTGLGILTLIIGGCATIFGFWTSYGLALVSLLVVVCSFLALFQLHCNETLGDWWRRKSPRSLKALFGILFVAGCVLLVVSVTGAYSLSDLFRPEFGRKPIVTKSYKGTSAPWASPTAGLTGDAKTAADLAGWKRLINSAITNDPQNQKNAVRQLFYFESSPFNGLLMQN